MLSGVLWVSGCWPVFWWDRRFLPGFQEVALVFGVHDLGLASGVHDAGLTSNGLEGFCQKCGPGYGIVEGRDS